MPDLNIRRRSPSWPPSTRMVVVLVLVLACVGPAAHVGWADSTTVSIEPGAQTLAPGNTATTDVVVSDVNELYGFEVHLSFDPDKASILSIAPGSFLSPDMVVGPTIDNEAGTADYGITQFYPAEPVSGDGALVTIEWQGVEAGISPVHFTNVILGNIDGEVLPITVVDGEISVAGGCTSTLVGDCNCDCSLNVEDLSILSEFWRHDATGTLADYDVIPDGIINVRDFMAVAADFGKECLP